MGVGHLSFRFQMRCIWCVMWLVLKHEKEQVLEVVDGREWPGFAIAPRVNMGVEALKSLEEPGIAAQASLETSTYLIRGKWLLQLEGHKGSLVYSEYGASK